MPFPFLCQRKPATTQSAVRRCLILSIVRSPARYGRVEPLGHHAVEPGALEAPEPVLGEGTVAAWPGERCTGGAAPASTCLQPFSPLARAAPRAGPRRRARAGPRPRTTPASARRRSFTRDAAGWMRRSERLELEPAARPRSRSRRRRTQRSGSAAASGSSELREVAVHRLLVAALQEDLVAVPKHERPEAVPLGLEQPALAVRQGIRGGSRASARAAERRAGARGGS